MILRGRNATKQYLAEFERLRSGTFGDLHERHEDAASRVRLGDMRVKPLFAPQHGPEMEIMKQMLKSQASIDFAMFTFAAVVRHRRHHGPSGRARPQHPRRRSTAARVSRAGRPPSRSRRAGVQLFQNRPATGVRKIHHKLMVIDERLIIAGSFNYTEPATTLNDENIVVLGDLEEPTGTAADANQRRLAGFALAEIDRIISDLCDPV